MAVDKYGTYVSKEEAEICEYCPYPLPKCGANGCEHFKTRKAELLRAKRDKRQVRGKNIK